MLPACLINGSLSSCRPVEIYGKILHLTGTDLTAGRSTDTNYLVLRDLRAIKFHSMPFMILQADMMSNIAKW